MKSPVVLGIETSCDETAVALYRRGEVLAESVHSQVDIHRYYGGVVPELASRDHAGYLRAVASEVLQGWEGSIDLVCATRGPGLIGGLLVGLTWARAYAFGQGLPFVGVHHLAGHLAAPLVDPEFTLEPPAIALVASGGHTLLYDLTAWGEVRVLGGTRDDAAGECFDKAARMLNLGYPGGPAIQSAAAKHEGPAVKLPRPMLKRGLEMSFSGLKTALLTEVQSRPQPLDESTVNELAYAVQDAIVDVLLTKLRKALEVTGRKRVLIGGGVAANQPLRDGVAALENDGFEVYIPARKYCTDNAAMIAAAGLIQFERTGPDPLNAPAQARWDLQDFWPLTPS